MDRAPVTNARFQTFVKATGYTTVAERQADPALYPEADPDQLVPASIVFVPPAGPVGQETMEQGTGLGAGQGHGSGGQGRGQVRQGGSGSEQAGAQGEAGTGDGPYCVQHGVRYAMASFIYRAKENSSQLLEIFLWYK
jgi:formylglycine-generating enzyme required for sulfatase activity